MKKYLLTIVAVALLLPANAQFLNRLVNGAANAAEKAVQKEVNKKVEEGVEKAFNSEEEQSGENAAEEQAEEQPSKQTSQVSAQTWTCPACGHSGNTGKFCNECGAKKPEQQSATWTCPACGHTGNEGKFCNECGAKRPDGNSAQADRAQAEWKKFDFVPGDEVIFYDQLDGEQLGEFPSKWELLNGECEIQRSNGENVIALMPHVDIMPLMNPSWNYLPDVYTVEFDYYEFVEQEGEDYGDLHLNFYANKEGEDTRGDWLWGFTFDNFVMPYEVKDQNLSKNFTTTVWATTTDKSVDNTNLIERVEPNEWHHVSISVNKRAIKIYFDEKRVFNLPNYKNPNGGHIEFTYDFSETPAYIRNVRIAKGAVPLYDRMLTDGKFITYGITFDVGKAVIKPESMGEINRIVKLMNDDPSLRFEVQGHTDNTGNAANNQKLSEQRAQAIVAKLVETGISADRLSAVGKGQTSPLADNSTAEGRAKNRRVEFVKK